MKKIKIFSLAFLLSLCGFLNGCKDKDKFPIPDFNSAVHGFGQLSGTDKSYRFGENNSVDLKFRWISIDGKLEVEKAQMYIHFDEDYKDKDGVNRTANHGGTGGKTDNTLIFMNLKNREDKTFTVTRDFIYNLYKDNTFNYDNNNGVVSVFNNPAKPERTSLNRFVPGDKFRVSWILTTKDGKVFSQWSGSVCGELPGANCQVNWGITCISDLAGTFDYVQTNMKGGAGVPTPIPAQLTGTVTWTKGDDGKYLSSDFTFGHFPGVWGDNPVTEPRSKMRLNDSCGKLTLEGTDQYGDSYTYKILSINGTKLTLEWVNTFNDGGTVELTRQDGKNWPTTLR